MEVLGRGLPKQLGEGEEGSGRGPEQVGREGGEGEDPLGGRREGEKRRKRALYTKTPRELLSLSLTPE